MGNLWLKIKVGTKLTIFVVLTIATLLFLFNNINKPVKIWAWNEYDTTLLKVLFFTALISVIFTVLIGTAFRTVRQIREIRARNRASTLEAEIRDMKQKAAMLQTKPAVGGAAPTALADIAPAVDDADDDERA
jgi:hypothetical protein